MNTDELRIFSRVAELASFSRAADQLGLTRARVSVAVQQLEERLGTRLLQRTTRSVRLTEDGARFLDRCKDYLAEGEQLATMRKFPESEKEKKRQRRGAREVKKRCSRQNTKSSAPTTMRVHHELSVPSKEISVWMMPSIITPKSVPTT